MARKRILVTKKALEEDKHAVWNAFIDLLVRTDYDELMLSQHWHASPFSMIARF